MSTTFLPYDNHDQRRQRLRMAVLAAYHVLLGPEDATEARHILLGALREETGHDEARSNALEVRLTLCPEDCDLARELVAFTAEQTAIALTDLEGVSSDLPTATALPRAMTPPAPTQPAVWVDVDLGDEQAPGADLVGPWWAIREYERQRAAEEADRLEDARESHEEREERTGLMW